MNRTNLKRAMLAALMIALLLSATGCFIQPDPLDDQEYGDGLEISLPIITDAPVIPLPTQTQDFSAWATNAPPNSVAQSLASESLAEPTDPPQEPTATVAPTLGIVLSSETLVEGAKGLAVRDLQLRLQELGYYSGKIDGEFGAATGTALKEFQKANGLSSDGVAGPMTIEVLNSSNAVYK